MEHLGGAVDEPLRGRDDWIVRFPEGTAVMEVKGVRHSAAERDAAQLEKWVSQRLLDTGVVAKGILAVNAWRDLPLDQRTKPAFPDQMRPYSVDRKHCLVTGIQLLGILLTIRSQAQKLACRKMLLSTSGVVKGLDDWGSYLEHESVSDRDGD